MPLSVIKGPPNSGRTELVRERFEARLADDPVLVVPSTDDIFGWERRLTRRRQAFVGGKVVHFKDLIGLILDGDTSGRPDPTALASPLRRRSLAVESIRVGWPGIADRLRDQPGLVDATLQVIDEFRASLIDPDTLEARGEETGPIAAVYREYLDRLAAAGLTDLPARAQLATTRRLEGWSGRPVFVAGFDDLTVQQLELLRRLAEWTDVSIAITHERGNRAMAVTEALLGRLQANGAAVEQETERPDSPLDHDPLLADLERAFLRPELDGTIRPSPALKLIEASGRRGEAEAIGAEIARLIDRRVDPGEIAITIDAPAANGGTIAAVLAEYGIPATLEAETKAPETATGQTVLNFLRAGSRRGTAAEMLAWLRGATGIAPDRLDEIEFASIRAGHERADQVARLAEQKGIELPGWSELRAGEVAEAVRQVVRRSTTCLLAAQPAGPPPPGTVTETQMATAIERAIAELESFTSGDLTGEAVIEALTSGGVKVWAVPADRTVRIASPYSMRAKRVRHLFMASLQERDLSGEEGSPLLSRPARAALGLPELTDQEDQETYLFYSCLAVPTESLCLSHRVADVHGKAEFPSPMIGEVTRLFVDGGAGIERIRRSGSNIVFPPDRAPSLHEWARSNADREPEPQLLGTGAESEMVEQVTRARAKEETTRTLAPIDSAAAAGALVERNMFSATALEAFIECPYKWFFERAMGPVRFGPEPEPLAKGSLIHEVLAELYRRHPDRIPGPDDVDEWIEQMRILVEELADSCDLGGDSAEHRIQRRQVAVEIRRFLERESRRTGTAFRPLDLERRFGFDDPESLPRLEIDGWNLRGIVDRVDVDGSGAGIVLDYKSGASSYKSLAEIRREGKVQLHLYLRALERLWGLDPAAGLYVPVFAAKHQSRGMFAAGCAAAVKDLGTVGNDAVEDLQAEIEAGVARASEAARKILAGEIHHHPGECLDHYIHSGVPDWNPDTEDEGANGR
ncbi:MAG: PD-(D/E)XK nuclease family protein [Solirubrobacterales bacterium]|nr:PD-(D/E)XK nuclease family protein [Solirubrobacterales bacterium]